MTLYAHLHHHHHPTTNMAIIAHRPWGDHHDNNYDRVIFIAGATATTTTTSTTTTPARTGSIMSRAEAQQHYRLPGSSDFKSGLEGLDPLPHFLAVWGVAVVLLSLCVVTVVSNSTMLTMFVLRRGVRRCKNIYVASLAAADLGIGLTLPVATLEQVESRWALQGVPCRLYQTVRCSLLYVSLLSILLISLDRWWSIHYPFTYRVRQSKKLAAVAVAMVWAASFALHVPPVLLWNHLVGEDPSPPPDNSGVIVVSGSEVPSTILLPVETEGIPTDGTREASSGKLAASTFSSSSSSLYSSSSFISVLTTASWTMADRRAFSQGGGGEEEKEKREVGEELDALHVPSVDRGRCELPYDLSFSYVLTSSVVLYFFPLLALWVLNLSLYFKITRRKSLKIRRSLSVNDNYLLPFRKSSSESESSPPNNNNNGNEAGAGDASGGGGGGGGGTELRSAEQRQRLLQAARAGRRHTLAFAGLPPVKFGSSVGTIYYPSHQTVSRNHSFRRVSVCEAFSGIGTNLAAVGGALPNLPRVNSCGRFAGNSGSAAFGFGSGHRQSVCSTSRKQSEDLVKELLVRQDRKAARLLGLLVTAFTLCWLPHTVTAVLHASDPGSRWLSGGWLRDLTFWVLVTNSAINPFLYGLLNAEFRKILRDWFYFQQRPLSSYRLKHAMLYWSLPGNADSDGVNKDAATAAATAAAATAAAGTVAATATSAAGTAAAGVPVASHALFATPIEE